MAVNALNILMTLNTTKKVRKSNNGCEIFLPSYENLYALLNVIKH